MTTLFYAAVLIALCLLGWAVVYVSHWVIQRYLSPEFAKRLRRAERERGKCIQVDFPSRFGKPSTNRKATP